MAGMAYQDMRGDQSNKKDLDAGWGIRDFETLIRPEPYLDRNEFYTAENFVLINNGNDKKDRKWERSAIDHMGNYTQYHICFDTYCTNPICDETYHDNRQ